MDMLRVNEKRIILNKTNQFKSFLHLEVTTRLYSTQKLATEETIVYLNNKKYIFLKVSMQYTAQKNLKKTAFFTQYYIFNLANSYWQQRACTFVILTHLIEISNMKTRYRTNLLFEFLKFETNQKISISRKAINEKYD